MQASVHLTAFTHWALGDMAAILTVQSSISIEKIVTEALAVNCCQANANRISCNEK